MISTSEPKGEIQQRTASPTFEMACPPSGVRVVDLCCGLGGLSLAARQLGMQIVAGIDLNSNAMKTFGKNFPGAEAIEGSVRSKTALERCAKALASGNENSLPCIVLSGPPCQGFSAAGSRDPKDRRNKVIVSVARAIAELQPLCAVIENVSMVLAEKHGTRLTRFEEILRDGDYFVQRVLLNASEFGVSQKRRRAFFLITREKLDEQDIFRRLACSQRVAGGAQSALNGLPVPPVRPDDYDDEKSYGPVFNHFAMRHSQAVMDKIAAIVPGKGPMSYRRLHPTLPSNTLFSGHRAPPAHFSEPRSITVREAARLQGFPDDFRIYGSFANQMEQVTNAVPPPLTRAVLTALADFTGFSVCDHVQF
jgi:DNA (cytosine-5)-methyltransferase 1